MVARIRGVLGYALSKEHLEKMVHFVAFWCIFCLKEFLNYKLVDPPVKIFFNNHQMYWGGGGGRVIIINKCILKMEVNILELLCF